MVERTGTKETTIMALNIKSSETHRMAQELAELTGETQTEAVTIAIRERLERLQRRKSKEGLSEKLLAIGRETGPLFVEPYKSTPHGDLLYDENGLPK